MRVIIIPTEMVTEIKGDYGIIPSRLEPYEMEVNGEPLWLLPYDVLADSEFAEVHETLACFETIDLED